MKTVSKANLLQMEQPVAHTVAQLKGRRLRMARALTGFSRQELYEKIGIATSTIDTWESGRVELTERSAERVCEAFRKVGIYCASSWLLSGMGAPPRMMDDVEKSIFAEKDTDVSLDGDSASDNLGNKLPPFLDEDVGRELSFFISLHENTLFYFLEEDFMNSRFKVGDCVAGVEGKLEELEGKIIIAQFYDGKTTICKLLEHFGNENDVFLNAATPKKRVKLQRAAEVLWHRMSKKKKG